MEVLVPSLRQKGRRMKAHIATLAFVLLLAQTANAKVSKHASLTEQEKMGAIMLETSRFRN